MEAQKVSINSGFYGVSDKASKTKPSRLCSIHFTITKEVSLTQFKNAFEEKLMKRFLLTTFAVFCVSFMFNGQASAQGGAGPGQGGPQGGVEIARPDTASDIVDSRGATGAGENNNTLGGGGPAANDLNFIQSLLGGNAGNNNNVNQNQAIRGRGVRAPFRLGFKFESLSKADGLKNLNARLVRLPRFSGQNVTAILKDKQLILIGEVESEETKNLAARVSRFEPGVDNVTNLLTVARETPSKTAR